MNARILRPVVAASLLVAVAGGASAESLSNVVTTRSDQNIDMQYGRDSVYAFSNETKPMRPDQTSSRSLKSYGAEAWHKTERFATKAWDSTIGALTSRSDKKSAESDSSVE